MPGKRAPKTSPRVAIRGKGWRRPTTVAADKYAAISRAILASLPATPISFTELVRRVDKRLRDFAGSIPWYTVAGLRELETRGRVRRHRQPVRYSRR